MGLEKYQSEEIYREAERRLANETTEPKTINLICMSDVEEENTEWLYYPYIPKGKITLCAAYPGTGKTYLLCYIAACVSTGRQLFDLCPFPSDAGNVVYLSSEDGLGDTLKKRMRLCGADFKRIYSVVDKEATLTFDSPMVEEIIKRTNPALLIFDPFQSYIGENVELNAANKTRSKLNNIVSLAEKYNIAIVLICHFNKNQKGDAITRIIGSTDIVGVCRSYLALGNVPEEEGIKYMSHEKSSLSMKGDTILFEIDPEQGGIKYIGQSKLTMDDYNKKAEKAKRTAPNIDAAAEFVKTQMPEGSRTAKEIKELAEANGISARTLSRAVKQLGIITKRVGFGGDCIWTLPSNTE